MADLTVVVTKAGAQPTPPAALLAALLAAVAAQRPGYTANLPGILIEDISSTDVGALAVCDAAVTETINSLTPWAANPFTMSQLGQIYVGQGSAPAVPTNTSVYATFEGPPGFVVAVGFTVSDGTYQYVVQSGGVIADDGFSEPLFCLATRAGSWAVPTNTVTQLITSVPTGVDLSCTNQRAGVPGGDAETESEYRARVLQAGQAISQGTQTMLKTALGRVDGVQERLVSVKQKTDGWEIIVGGGDPYEVAYAIYMGLFDISSLQGSVLAVTNITQAADGLVTTDLNHGFSNGQEASISGIVGMTPLNGIEFTVEVVTEKSFKTGINTTGYPAYVSGGIVSPNLRNVSVSIDDYPDVYVVPFVDPPQQTVVVVATWDTSSPNFVSGAAVAQLANPAIVAYINSIRVGAPINLYQLETTFQLAVASVLAPELLTRMVFAVSINGVGVEPVEGTGVIAGDPESYFLTTTAQVVVQQG